MLRLVSLGLRLSSRLRLRLTCLSLWLCSRLLLGLRLRSLRGLGLPLGTKLLRQPNSHILQHFHWVEGSAVRTLHTLHQVREWVALSSPWTALEEALERVLSTLPAKCSKHRCWIEGLRPWAHHVRTLIWIRISLRLWGHVLYQVNRLIVFLNYERSATPYLTVFR